MSSVFIPHSPFGIPHYKVTVAIPHLDTPEPLNLALDLWAAQTARPYLMVVDTGSTVPKPLSRPGCDVHHLARPVAPIHPSASVAAALDVAQALCPTEYLLHTHTDVFPRRRDFLEWMLGQCNPDTPVVGWRMSPRSRGPWHECVSHTATMIHIPTARRLGLVWSMDEFFRVHPEEVRLMGGGWPDTESGFRLSMVRSGFRPKLLGDELNFVRQQTDWWDHARSYTGLKLGGNSPLWDAAKSYMADAMAEARTRLAEWNARS